MTGLFGTNQAQTVTPTPKPVAPMPDPLSPEVMEARRKAQLDIMGRAGRTSTILTAPSQRNTLSAIGDSFASSSLGSGS